MSSLPSRPGDVPHISALQLDRLQQTLRVPPVLADRYRIESVLGRGGMGVVYRAEDTILQRAVAVKVIDPALASSELEVRLEREARLLGRLSHPGIVPVYDLGRQDELTLFYVMKHVDGETLEQWLPKHPSSAERLRLFQKLCDPVSFAHAQGIAHRDLKPANVMIGAFGEVLIMDWGLARRLDDDTDAESVGTPGYHDPTSAIASTRAEWLVGADVYSLGALLYYLLTGHHPPADAEALQPSANAGTLQPRRINSSIDPRLDAICARSTHPARSQRYASARELEAEILRYLDGAAVHAYEERWHEVAARWARRHQLLLSIVLMYLLMRVVVALVR